MLARRLVEVGCGEQPDRDFLLDLSAVHGTRPLPDTVHNTTRAQSRFIFIRAN
jgi:hypothetical protein